MCTWRWRRTLLTTPPSRSERCLVVKYQDARTAAYLFFFLFLSWPAHAPTRNLTCDASPRRGRKGASSPPETMQVELVAMDPVICPLGRSCFFLPASGLSGAFLTRDMRPFPCSDECAAELDKGDLSPGLTRLVRALAEPRTMCVFFKAKLVFGARFVLYRSDHSSHGTISFFAPAKQSGRPVYIAFYKWGTTRAVAASYVQSLLADVPGARA